MEAAKGRDDAQAPVELGPLPAGRHGYSREQIAHSQRERLIAAFAGAVAEHGYADTTLTHITTAAHVSRRAFYENFADKEACFLAAFDIIVDHLRKVMEEAGEGAPDWAHRVVAAIRAALRFLASEPQLARLCLVESVTTTPAIAARYREAILSFVPSLRQGRRERVESRELPESTEDSLIGASASMISRQIAAGGADRLEDLAGDITAFVLSPYLGSEEARRLAAEAPA